MKDRSYKRNRPVLTPDDYKRRRRERRKERTIQSEASFRAWAGKHGFSLRVLNEGHHWILEKPGLFAEWWPSSASFVLNRNYSRSFHAPHWPDVAAVIERSLASDSSAF